MYALSAGSQCYAHTLPLLLPSKGFKDLEGIVKMEEVRGAQENILSLESFFDPQKGDQVSGPLEEKATQSLEWEGKAQTRNTDMQFRSEL